MRRIADPLGRMGVSIETSEGLPPVTVHATGAVEPISYRPPVASAQVKSAVLFAGLFAERGVTVVEEAIATRDHTERMLQRAGVPVDRRPGYVGISPVRELVLPEIAVPGDFSSAAPFIAAATILQGSSLTLRDISINPTRTGMLAVLERMGARVGLFRRRLAAGEPVADIEVRPAELVATDIEAEIVPSLIDELPLMVLLASFARGTTTIRGAGELRVKESDRIATVVELLNTCGGHVTALRAGALGLRGSGSRRRGGSVRAVWRSPDGDPSAGRGRLPAERLAVAQRARGASTLSRRLAPVVARVAGIPSSTRTATAPSRGDADRWPRRAAPALRGRGAARQGR
jgi:3-phosphoshikimate 1-carboxyvinyltransferase